MTISGYPINATEEERNTYDAGTLDQLDAYLASVKGRE